MRQRPASGKPPQDPPSFESGPGLLAPSEQEWDAMTGAEREAFIQAVLDAHRPPEDAMSEGRGHKRAKERALDELGLYFKRVRGRSIYLADELAVLYPRERSFVPDLLAVLDVEQTEDDERSAWVVRTEGRGPDLVLEVLHLGNRDKDLQQNVERYARLGIREYFVLDRLNRKLLGYRLPRGGRRYAEIRPRLGRYGSQVLELDLAVVQGRLRFFAGPQELVGSEELIGRLDELVQRREHKVAQLEQAAREAQRQAEEAELARREAQRQAEEAELARREEALARREAQRQAEEAEQARREEALARREAQRQAEEAEQARREEALARREAQQQAEEAEQARREEALARREAQQQAEGAEQARQQEQRQAQAGLLRAIAALCGAYGIELTGERQELLCSLEAGQLLWLLDRLQSERAWPLSSRRRLVPTLQ